MIFGYARVSTDDQHLDGQLDALKAAGAERVFKEKISGARADRPELAKLLAKLGNGDELLVTRIDRLARSTRDLLNVLAHVAERGALFRSIADEWADTTKPHGQMILTFLSGIAEYERHLIIARTNEGRARAKAAGRHMGRPSKLTPQQKAQDLADLAAGRVTAADLARRHAMSKSSISRMLKKAAQAAPASRPQLDADTRRAAQSFLGRLKGRYAPLDAMVYGSRARGDHRPDSDADLAVIIKGRESDRDAIGRELSGVAYDVLIETGIRVQPLPLFAAELERPELFSNPALIENIKREGLRL